jgi:hypothetical protein
MIEHVDQETQLAMTGMTEKIELRKQQFPNNPNGKK